MSNGEWDELEKKPVSTLTDPLLVIYGAYKWLNECPIHYCLASLSVLNLWDDVRLMNEIPGVEKWGFEALFQRVVRDEWVSQIKGQYLSNPERFKFFPPVTIALLPCSNDVPLRNYEPPGPFEFTNIAPKGIQASLSGLTIRFPTQSTLAFPAFGNPAIIQWDKRKYVALAIDGQHRISALRGFVPKTSQEVENKDVPAVLVIFDPSLPNGRDLIQATREIFIDINKNAKTVDDSRLILLDDRNFYNSLTRKAILQAYPDGETPSSIAYEPIEKEIEFSILSGIPQELIDTAMGREAADANKLKPWQFTSAFILKRAIQYFFFEDDFQRFEELLDTTSFSVDSADELEAKIAERRQEYEDGDADGDEHIADQDMLSFRPVLTAELVERGMRMHRGILLGVFTAFQPYKQQITKFATAIGGADGSAIRSLILAEGSYPGGTVKYETKIASELQADRPRFKRIKKSIEGFSKPQGWESNLYWYSIFQRGLIFQPMLIRRALDNARNSSFSSREEFAQTYVTCLDSLADDGWFVKDFQTIDRSVWGGIALKLGDSGEAVLDGSDGAAKRTGQLIRLMVAAVAARDVGGFTHLKSRLSTQGLKGAKTAVEKGYARFLKAKDSVAGSPKDDTHYAAAAEKLLEAVLKSIANSNQI
jgi:hypothetical protein